MLWVMIVVLLNLRLLPVCSDVELHLPLLSFAVAEDRSVLCISTEFFCISALEIHKNLLRLPQK